MTTKKAMKDKAIKTALAITLASVLAFSIRATERPLPQIIKPTETKEAIKELKEKEEKPAMKEGHSTKRAGVRAPVRPVHVGVAAPEQKKVEALETGPKKEVKTEEVIPMGAPKPKSDEAIPMGAPKPKADEAIPLGAPAPKSDEAIPLGSPSQETGGKEE